MKDKNMLHIHIPVQALIEMSTKDFFEGANNCLQGIRANDSTKVVWGVNCLNEAFSKLLYVLIDNCNVSASLGELLKVYSSCDNPDFPKLRAVYKHLDMLDTLPLDTDVFEYFADNRDFFTEILVDYSQLLSVTNKYIDTILDKM